MRSRFVPWPAWATLGLCLLFGGLSSGCFKQSLPYVPDLAPPATPDGGDVAADLQPAADLPKRPPWRLLSPVPEGSDLRGIAGIAAADYHVITEREVIHRVAGQSVVRWRGSGPSCLHGVAVVGADLIAAGGCGQSGLLVRGSGPGALWAQEVPNLELAGVYARQPDEIYVASPTLGVLRVTGQTLHLERTTVTLGGGPVAVFGLGGEVYAVGNGRILHRLGADRWEVASQSSGDLQVGGWSMGQDLYVVGSSQGKGAVWHRSGDDPAFVKEPLPAGISTGVLSIWGSGPDDVYALADGGVVLRRSAGAWEVDRPPGDDQPGLLSLWGPGDPGALWAVGPAGILRRTPGLGWASERGGALTGARLWGAAAAGPGESYVVGGGGVILHQQEASWQHEGRGLTPAALHGVVALPDGTAYAVGEAGTVLYRQPDGRWVVDRQGLDPALLAVAATPTGEIYAAGEGATLLRRAGGTWQKGPPFLGAAGVPLQVTLRALAALPDGTVVAAGDEGTVLLQSLGGALVLLGHDSQTSLSFTGLTVVRGRHGPEVWGSASGAAALLHLRDGRFTTESSPLADATGIAGSAPDDLYLCGLSGAVMHFDGARWAAETVPTGEALRAIAGGGPATFSAGDQGFLIQRPYP